MWFRFDRFPVPTHHGLQSLGGVDALVLNFPTEAYNYKDPDHYRLPHDTPEIPYAWKVSDSSKTRKDQTPPG